MPTVTLNGCRPDKDRITISAGENVEFKSGDGKGYIITFGSKNSTVADNLPLQVPGNGSGVMLSVKKGIPVGTYMFAIQNAHGEQCWPVADSGPGDVPPGVIVK